MAVILRYFSEFGELPGALRKSLRSLSHLMSSCYLRLRGCIFGDRFYAIGPLSVLAVCDVGVLLTNGWMD